MPLTICQLRLIAFALLLFVPAAAQTSPAEAELKQTTQKFFAFFERKDVAGLNGMWGNQAADQTATIKKLESSWGAVGDISIQSLVISRIIFEEKLARVFAHVELQIVNLKTKQPETVPGGWNRTLTFRQESSTWKLLSYSNSEMDLALAIGKSQTNAEREQLLLDYPELVNVELRKAMTTVLNEKIIAGNYVAAQEVVDFTIRFAERIGDKTGIASSIVNTGLLLRIQSKYEQALEQFNRALKLAEELNDKRLLSYIFDQTAVVLMEQGKHQQAYEIGLRGLRAAEEAGDILILASRLVNLATICDWLGDSDGYYEYTMRALKIREKEGASAVQMSITLGNLAGWHIQRENYNQALEYLSRALKLAESENYFSGVVFISTNIGNVFRAQGNQELSLKYYQRALEVAEKIQTPLFIQRTLLEIGVLFSTPTDYEKAIPYFERGLKIAREIKSENGIISCQNGLAVTYYLAGKYQEAISLELEALRLAESNHLRLDMPSMMIQIGQAFLAQQKYAESLEWAEKAMTLSREVNLPLCLWQSYTLAGQANQALGKQEIARQLFQEAIKIIEQLRYEASGNESATANFFNNKLEPYYQLIASLLASGQTEQALLFTQQTKARTLANALQNGRVNVIKSLPAEEQKQEHELLKQLTISNKSLAHKQAAPNSLQPELNELKSKVKQARLAYEDYVTFLYAKHPVLQSQRGNLTPLRLNQIGELLPNQKTAILEFVVMENSTLLFVMTKKASAVDLRTYSINIKKDDLAVRVKRFQTRLANQDFNYQELAKGLYNLLLVPAQSSIADKTSLIIIPDGSLWELPFQSLLSPQNRFVIEQHAISIAPSLPALQLMLKSLPNQPARHSLDLLALGNPDLAKGNSTQKSITLQSFLNPLPEAERQVIALKQIYAQTKNKVLIGPQANEAQIKAEAGNYKILHFATHGVINNASPMYSQLVLSQTQIDDKNDGMLEAHEILDMDFNADLVVLAACETALGKVNAGEGIIGMSWAFLLAGCPTVVVSQWKVESSSTTELMLAFHRQVKANLQKTGRMNVAESLRQAMLTVMKQPQYRHPAYWAGFISIGQATR